MTSSINSSLAAILSQSSAVAAGQSGASQDSTAQAGAAQPAAQSGFGAAVNLTLSPAAQAVLANQSANSNTASAGPPALPSGTGHTPGAGPAPQGKGGGGGGAPVSSASSSSSSSVETLIQEDEQKLIPEVGVNGASEVIDSKGNIDQVKLQQLLTQQDQPPQQSQSQVVKLVA